MCHCSFDATFSPDWQRLRSVPHMSIFPQAFCCNKRVLSSLPLPTMSINAILRYALYLGMSSLSKWHSHNRGLWNRSFFFTLHRLKFFSLICINPGVLIRDTTWVSMWGRLCSLRACERLHTQMLSCTSFFSVGFTRQKKTSCTAAGHLFDVGLFLVANEMWTNRQLSLNGRGKTNVFSFLYSSDKKKIYFTLPVCW